MHEKIIRCNKCDSDEKLVTLGPGIEKIEEERVKCDFCCSYEKSPTPMDGLTGTLSSATIVLGGDITLKSGRTYASVTLKLLSPTVALITHSSGSTRVDVSDLPKDVTNRLLSPTQTWTSKDGRVIQARFIAVRGSTVVIDRNGQIFNVPLSNLSPQSVEQARRLAGTAR
jgi:hypothetical protein